VLFLDEVHRFNKAQQDAFLPWVEDGTLVFIGATTENPSFELNNALLSRAKVYVLRALTEADLQRVLDRALAQTGVAADAGVLELLARAADGDARRALNMLELAQRVRCRILQASTSEVYGDPLIHPQTEEYLGNVNPIGVRSCYDEGKRCAETLFFDYHRQYGVDIKVARIFNTYGPRMQRQDGRVVSNIITQALAGKPLTAYGDGCQTRSFCYVDDMVEGLLRLMNSAAGVTGPVNLGNPHEISILELAKIVLELTDSSSGIEFRACPPDDPRQRRPDIALAAARLGWRPKIPLRTGLQRTIAFFRADNSEVCRPAVGNAATVSAAV
jgi:nucleoside-diphosphate-sugar epimerase